VGTIERKGCRRGGSLGMEYGGGEGMRGKVQGRRRGGNGRDNRKQGEFLVSGKERERGS